MKVRSIAWVLLFTMTPVPLVAFEGPAFAQAASDEATTAMARARFKEGVGYYDKKQYEAARAAFIQAYALKKHPAVLLNLAWSSLKAGHVMESERYFAQFLRDAPTASAADKGEAEKGLAEARAQLGRIQIDAPVGTEVMVDHDGAGKTPMEPVTVEPGMHSVRFKGAEGQEGGQMVFVGAGQLAPAKFNPPPVAQPVKAAALPASVVSMKSAQSVSDPDGPATSPLSAAPLNPDVTSSPGAFAPPRNMGPVYIGLGLSLASFGVAGGMFYAKQSAQDKADNVASEIRSQPGSHAGVCSSTNPAEVARFGNACKALSDNNDAVDKDAMIANIAIGAGALALAATVVYYFVAPKKVSKRAASNPSPTAPVVTPLVGQRIGGLMVQGEF